MEFYKVKITRKGTKPPIGDAALFLQISHLHRWQLYLKRFWNMKLHLYMNLNFSRKSTHPGMDRRRGKRNLAV